MRATVYNLKGEKVSEQELDVSIFGLKVKPELIQLAVVAQLANARRVIAHTKDRSEVRGGGRKPWRQKGTGRARHGSIRSPLWIGGGVTFGPTKNRNFSIKINKKAKRKALLMALSDRAQSHHLILLDHLDLSEIKTKKAFEILQNLKLRPKKEKVKVTHVNEGKSAKLGDSVESETQKVNSEFERSILIAVPTLTDAVIKSFKNIPRVNTIAAQNLNVLEIVKHHTLLMPKASLEKIKEVFGKK